MELIDNPEWLVGHRLGFVLSPFYEVVHRAEPRFVMDVSPPTNLAPYHGFLGKFWTKGDVTWWERKPGFFATRKLKNIAFEKFEQYFNVRNEVGRSSPVSINGYCTSCVGRIGGFCGPGYGTDWFVGRPPEALTFYCETANSFDDWVVHLAEPVFSTRVRGLAHVESATTATGDKLEITAELEGQVIQALRSYYYGFFASLDNMYNRYKKPFALALYTDPFLDPESPDYHPKYEFDEEFVLWMKEWQTKDIFYINFKEAAVYRNDELLSLPTDMLEFNLSADALTTLWLEDWFASDSVPVSDFSGWVPFPRDNPYIIVASTLLAAFLKDVSFNVGNVLPLRLFIPLARELALTSRGNETSITGERLLQWVNSKLKLPPDAPVSLFDESTFRATCATA